MPRIPLIEDLTKEPVPPGSKIIVEYDPGSVWNYASLTMVAGWLKSGGTAAYETASQSPDDVRSQLSRLGLNVPELERKGDLIVWDDYTLTLGQRSTEQYTWSSLKVADISIMAAAWAKAETPWASLEIVDDESVLARFNDEKAWVEFELSRAMPIAKARKYIRFIGITKGVHSDWAFRKLEAGCDGIVDFKLDEAGEEIRSLMRIRALRNVHFDSRWRALKVGGNFEVTLEK